MRHDIKFLFKAFFFFAIFSFCSIKSSGQNTINEEIGLNEVSPYIQWVKEFPVHKNDKKSIGLFKSVGNFFFGKPIVSITKPISVLANNPDTLWILDQGDEKIINVTNGVSKIPSFIAKSDYVFTSLLGASFISEKEFIFTDSRLNKIFNVNIKDGTINVLNDPLELNQPTGIAYSSISNQIWVVETASHQISILNREGELVKKIGKRGAGFGEFNFPTFIWIDKLGSVYVVDAMNFRIQIFDLDGKFKTSFGNSGDGSGSFASPKGIATDTFGNI